MPRFHTPASDLPNVNFGSNIEMSGGAWVEVRDGGNFWCAPNAKLLGVRITVYPGASVKIGQSCTLRGLFSAYKNSLISIGSRTIFNAAAEMKAGEGASISIGNDCLIANATVYSSDFHAIYDTHSRKRINLARDINIHDRVWLAQNSVVLKGAEIGPNTVVGAGAVVSGKFPGSTIIAGSPARIIRRGITWSRDLHDEIPPHLCPSATEEEKKLTASARDGRAWWRWFYGRARAPK